MFNSHYPARCFGTYCAKIPRHTSKNPIAEGNFHWIFARNCEGTEQLRRFANNNIRRGIETNENVQGQNVQDDLQ